MAVSWTKEQQQVIDLRHRNLLVSAAAGSGKTAVLVERILSLVTDRENPVDIDRLLVVTFTRAAAGEMKDRIGRALEERLQQDPENMHLQRQGVLLDHAQISTIDGFCTFVLQNYFHRIGLDPSYRIAEEEELKVLRSRVLEELLEEEYTSGKEAFRRFVRAYGGIRSDQAVTDLITKIYTFAVSNPDPDSWLEHCLQAYTAETAEELEQTDWRKQVLRETGYLVKGLEQRSERLAAFVEDHPEGPQVYLPALQTDARMLASLQEAETYAAYREMLSAVNFVTLPRKVEDGEDRDLREYVRKERNTIKDEVTKLRTQMFSMSEDSVLQETIYMRPYAEELIRLVRRFREAFTAAKKEQNLLDFSDLELLALQVLAEKQEDGSWHPTEPARELAARFEEVMIDEYQDSNYLQEALLSSVARMASGKKNRFMVGDIKQSIYGFRQARPDLFLEHYQNAVHMKETVPEDPDSDVCIDLHQNFRSRPEVLDSVNAVFSRIMIPELGGIRYDDAAALHAGAAYPEEQEAAETELLVIDKKDPVFQNVRGREVRTEAEAFAAARKIQELMRGGRLWDADKKAYRPVRYRDCVILLRAASSSADIFVRVLQQEGIPAYAVSGKGYFTTLEVSTVLDYLRIVDNPLQDIPLAAVLHSPIVGLTDTELAEIRAAEPKKLLFDAVLSYSAGGSIPGDSSEHEAIASVASKLQAFIETLKKFRENARRVPIHTLLSDILRETGYGDFVAAMPAGAQRQANLDMLVERAVSFEKTKYHGLFQFIRYIEQLEESNVDFGEVNLYGEEEDIVRIMTIHKSKGLEFPVVLLAGMGKRFNKTDELNRVLMHGSYGIGMSAVYPEEHRIHRNTLLHTAVRNAIRRDMMAEELRILYVAMTRAKEKLILIGDGEAEDRSPLAGGELTYQQILGAGTYLDWVRMASCSAVIREEILRGEDLAVGSVSEEIRIETALQRINTVLETGTPGAYAPEIRELLSEKERFLYNESGISAPAKITVSELKRMAGSLSEAEESGEEMFPEPVVVPYIPKFIQAASEEPAAGQELSGAGRGTAYHHMFAVLDHEKFGREEDCTAENVRLEMDRMLEAGLLSAAEYAVIREEDFCRFLKSPLGRRMTKAALAGSLRREQPFVLDIPVPEFPDAPSVLIQGIIDAYWKEDDAWILVDYKTDRLQGQDGRELVEKYHKQLEYYERALTQITGIPVREAWIYSIYAGAIRL